MKAIVSVLLDNQSDLDRIVDEVRGFASDVVVDRVEPASLSEVSSPMMGGHEIWFIKAIIFKRKRKDVYRMQGHISKIEGVDRTTIKFV